MMTRTATASFAGRASTMRRLRRRATAANAASHSFCRTNGCASFLEFDPATGRERCPICGYERRPH